MKTIRMIFAAGVLLAAHAEAAKPFLISGYDDVLRQAENANVVRAAGRSMSESEGFAGMPELYKVIAQSTEPPFEIVSATSRTFESGATEFLKRSGYPAPVLHFRRWLLDSSATKFKSEQFAAVMAQQKAMSADRQFIFVFDNSDVSLDLSEQLLREHASDVAAIYVRETLQRKKSAGVIPFITAFEVAANEFASERMTEAEVAQVASAIVREQKTTRVVPDYAYCPFDYDPCGDVRAPLLDVCASVRTKVVGICEARRKR